MLSARVCQRLERDPAEKRKRGSSPRNGKAVQPDKGFCPTERRVYALFRFRQQAVPPYVFRAGQDDRVRHEVFGLDERVRGEFQQQIQGWWSDLISPDSRPNSAEQDSPHVALSVES